MESSLNEGGVESWWEHLSSMLLSLRDDWLVLDRVIEAAVSQCTLTWDGLKPGNLEDSFVSMPKSQALK